MKTSTIVWIVVIILIVIGGVWWYESSQGATQSTSSTTTTSQTPDATATLNVSSVNPTLGNYLVASNGMTLYKFNKDSVGTSTCYGACASEWPPYTVASSDNLTAASATGVISTITRTDGTMQVSYNGMPLYFFAQDASPGDATGQNDNGFTVVTP